MGRMPSLDANLKGGGHFTILATTASVATTRVTGPAPCPPSACEESRAGGPDRGEDAGHDRGTDSLALHLGVHQDPAKGEAGRIVRLEAVGSREQVPDSADLVGVSRRFEEGDVVGPLIFSGGAALRAGWCAVPGARCWVPASRGASDSRGCALPADLPSRR